MGGNQSDLHQVPMGFEFMCITFKSSDQMIVIYANDQEVNLIRETIEHHWTNGKGCNLLIESTALCFLASHESNEKASLGFGEWLSNIGQVNNAERRNSVELRNLNSAIRCSALLIVA